MHPMLSPAPQGGGFFRFIIRIVFLALVAWVGMALYNARHFSHYLTGEGSLGSSVTTGANEREGVRPGNAQPLSPFGHVGGIGKIGANAPSTPTKATNGNAGFWSRMFGGDSAEAPQDETAKNTAALLEAAFAGNTEKVERLLTQKLSIDGMDDNGRTALMFAAWNGKNAICADLLAAHANPAITDHQGYSAADYAAGRGLVETTQLLLKNTGDTHHDLEYAKAIHAAYAGDATSLPKGRFLTINRLNPEGQSPLHIAAGNGAVAVAEELVKGGANVNMQNSEGQTPLHWAAWNDKPQSVDWLVAHGAIVSVADGGGNTPLMLAAEHGSKDAALALLQKGADRTATNKQGQTASGIAREKGFDTLAELVR